jgi:hypothetical protein
MSKSSIPGLVCISEECGGRSFTFEIEDDKVDQFYAHFGLKANDVDGFQKIVEESIKRLVEIHEASKADPLAK